MISAISVALTCGSVDLPMREGPPLFAARAYRGATARSDVRVPQLPASGPFELMSALPWWLLGADDLEVLVDEDVVLT